VIKTWAFNTEKSHVVYALCKHSEGTKLYSIGRSLTGLLGQGEGVTESSVFAPLDLSIEIKDIFLVGELAMAISKEGEVVILGGE
jgi:hypothetical protein